MIMRGGTSKGAYFVEGDLPADVVERDQLLMQVMGTPDHRQIDGLGGAHPLTSKVAVVSPSDREDVDVEYLFLQLGVGEPIVTDRQNCGNIIAGVGQFAVERRLIEPGEGPVTVRILMRNTDGIAVSHFEVRARPPQSPSTSSTLPGVPVAPFCPPATTPTPSKGLGSPSWTMACLWWCSTPPISECPAMRAAPTWRRTRS
jgi:2-methylaconitate cis-trans-isomerase PrpF